MSTVRERDAQISRLINAGRVTVTDPDAPYAGSHGRIWSMDSRPNRYGLVFLVELADSDTVTPYVPDQLTPREDDAL